MRSKDNLHQLTIQSSQSEKASEYDRGLSIYFASSEIAPFAQTGGLGDVMESLPKALKKLGAKVSLIMPAYRNILQDYGGFIDTGISFNVPVSDRWEEGKILKSDRGENSHIFFIRADKYFDRNSIYGESGKEYPDNSERFVFFSRAILEVLKLNPPSILHANDWQTALSIFFLKTQPALYPELASTKTVFTIHNLGHQGRFWHLDWHLLKSDWKYFNPEYLEFYGKINFLKGGLIFADAITTVSPSYAEEITTPQLGFGLDGLFRAKKDKLSGFLNGADYEVWNPETDPYIRKTYGVGDLSGKQICKGELQSIFNLPLNPSIPVIGLVSRLAEQKGFDILIPAMDELLTRNLQIVLLGSGESRYESYFKILAKTHPKKVGVEIDYNEKMAHKIIAGSDIFLMPSLYEPGGLTQIYSLKYGTIPVARATGGLKDTIVNFDPETNRGWGFLFDLYDPASLIAGLDRALSVYSKIELWKNLMDNAMSANFSWERSAKAYFDLYQRLTGRRDKTLGNR